MEQILHTHRKKILLIILLVSAVYANSLLNGFIGDDYILIVDNSFYRSLENFPRLFAKDYIVSGPGVIYNPGPDLGAGSVSYRPASNATYFLDFALWGLNPFGYHLTSFLFHLCNSLLVYGLIFTMSRQKIFSFLAALLFAVHPINSEAVCNIGYRADVIAAFFFLLAFLTFVDYDRSAGIWRSVLHGISAVFFLFAVFSKESAIIFPLVILAYDFYFPPREGFRASSFLRRYSLFILVLIFYLYLYFFVFKNSTLNLASISFDIQRFFLMAQIFFQYVLSLFLPTIVQILPPFYTPTDQNGLDYKNIAALMFFIFVLFIAIKTYKAEKTLSYFLLFFLISFIPVSNIIPVTTPMAYRFMYLPMIGGCTILAFLIEKMKDSIVLGAVSIRAKKLLKAGFIFLCMLLTISLNGFWRSNFTLASQLTEHFPHSFSGHSILGIFYLKERLYEKSKEHLEKALELGSQNVQIPYLLGLCFYKDNPDQAAFYFQEAIEGYPDYSSAYFQLGRLSIRKKNYSEAAAYFNKTMELTPQFAAPYSYLLDIYLKSGETQKAEELFKKARIHLKDNSYLNKLQNTLKGTSL